MSWSWNGEYHRSKSRQPMEGHDSCLLMWVCNIQIKNSRNLHQSVQNRKSFKFYIFFLKTTHISLSKTLLICKTTTITVQICTVTVAFYMIFFSLSSHIWFSLFLCSLTFFMSNLHLNKYFNLAIQNARLTPSSNLRFFFFFAMYHLASILG